VVALNPLPGQQCSFGATPHATHSAFGTGALPAGWFSTQPGQMVLHSVELGSRAGGEQKPMVATQSQAWLSPGQHDGQAPPVSCGSSPGLQKSSWAKQSQVWSGVFENDCPGQHPSWQSTHSLFGTGSPVAGWFSTQPGQIFEHALEVGSVAQDGRAEAEATSARAVRANILLDFCSRLVVTWRVQEETRFLTLKPRS